MWFSFVLAAGSIIGLWIVSRNPKLGWGWCLFMEIPWVVYAFLIKQPGLAFLCIFYGGVYLNNLIRSRKTET